MSTLRNNIYFRSIFYFLDFAGILSILYINISYDNFRICLSKYDINNYVDLTYSWLLIVFLALKYYYTYYNKDVINTSITSKSLSFFLKLIFNIFSAGMSFLSFKIFLLQTNYVDSIPLKFNFYIHRVWTAGDLREYLSDVLLNKPSVISKFKDLQVELPLSETVTSKLLDNCNTLGQVETSLNNFINILESNPKYLIASDSYYNIFYNIGGKLQTMNTYLYDNGVYWWLTGLTVAVVVTIAGYYVFNSKVKTLAGETTTIRDIVVDSSCEHTEFVNQGLNDLSKDVGNLRKAVKNIDNKCNHIIETVEKNNVIIKDNINFLNTITKKQADDLELLSSNYISSLKNNKERIDTLTELFTINHKELDTLKQSVVDSTYLRTGEGLILLKQIVKFALKELFEAGEFGSPSDSDDNSGGGGSSGKRIKPISGNIRGFTD